ncbi:killer cell lectin-like receptor subfamily B member 1B allele B isoform X1 [Elephas maximus indicus]|uniref:killer cell lectin-like receptor subfamily B member 1B allele B isoform X1 n=1 Tax=Elephas maximus indicus TaxID=99487 RepID=UPI002116B3EF|nr:killer cell lectin-like receptor subfamily B member 1B allele B isoform X1 [Elephas maximus indicus]
MSGDIVYADIKTVKTSRLEHSSPLQKPDSDYHGIFLKAGCAMIIILLVTVIVLSIFVIQLNYAKHNEVNNESIKKNCTGKNESKTVTSKVSSNSPTVHQSCPRQSWTPHGGKCYWIAENEESWDKSRDICAMKNSHLFVIQDIIDMSFIWRHLKSSTFYWIGLTYLPAETSWIWVDNSSFNQNIFSVKQDQTRTRSMSCAKMSQSEIKAAKCDDKNQWICKL